VVQSHRLRRMGMF